mmetsp:Transcript_66896/g.196366  ORF Transcript_66896/g.196366 Transcript_66896/m.196366 type:complete len:115 (+) Transcript_66896:92-436(+)
MARTTKGLLALAVIAWCACRAALPAAVMPRGGDVRWQLRESGPGLPIHEEEGKAEAKGEAKEEAKGEEEHGEAHGVTDKHGHDDEHNKHGEDNPIAAKALGAGGVVLVMVGMFS